jgi:16S rRNA (guanine(966)-N(2))-methyltransferase RsmD
MRVIAGSRKGHRLMGPKTDGLRPTADRVKEALFSILSPRIVDARFLDLYAGTGAIGIEALSRGAQHVTFVESSPAALKVLRANLEHCGFDSSPDMDIRACTAESLLKRSGSSADPYDIVFADPPYDQQDAGHDLLAGLELSPIMAPHTTIILEHATRLTVPSQVGHLSRERQYRYGDTTLSLFRLQTEGLSSS